MRFTRRRDFTVRMSQYETLRFAAEVSLEDSDLPLDASEDPDKRWDALVQLVEERLAAALLDDLKQSAKLTSDPKSFVIRAIEAELQSQLPTAIRPKPQAQSRKTTRRTR